MRCCVIDECESSEFDEIDLCNGCCCSDLMEYGVLDNEVFEELHEDVGVLVSVRLMACVDWVVVVVAVDLIGVLATE